MRLFVALDISDMIRERLRLFMAELREVAAEAKLVRAESLHLTLKFLGETSAEKSEAVRAALLAVVKPMFPLSVSGTGFFPNERRPKVLWAGIEAPAELAALASAVDAACAKLGFAGEERAFTPHLTLARAGSGSPRQHAGRGDASLLRIADHLRGQPPASFGKMVASQFHLFESRTHASGPIYTKLATFPLKPTP